jgi:hypothetical protein
MMRKWPYSQLQWQYATILEVKNNCWTLTAEKLEGEGFSVERECIAGERSPGLWCVKISRDGREWTAYAGDAGAALSALESRVRDVVGGCDAGGAQL